MKVLTFSGGAFGQNGYLAVCEETDEVVIVDPGAAAPAMVRELRSSGATPTAILLTHAHLDHVEGIAPVRVAFPDVPIHLHPQDRPLYEAAPRQAAAFGVTIPELPPPDRALAAGQRFTFGSSTFEIRHAPGGSHKRLLCGRQRQSVFLDKPGERAYDEAGRFENAQNT